jgi:hypothetical protein
MRESLSILLGPIFILGEQSQVYISLRSVTNIGFSLLRMLA